MRLAAALIALAAAGACGEPASPPAADTIHTVAKILKQCGAFLGKSVQAAGYLGTCAGYDCHLFSSKTAAEAWYRYSLGSAPDAEEPQAVIGIGGGNAAFDAKAAPLQNSDVVITGRMDEHSCDGRGGSDRSPGVHPTDIRAWTPAEGAPGNSH